ncbi:unnamed protein product [Peronospora farinosa]|uniref:Jacalin-type lectin domain-containing protein n=1 Tax=Peronospora farinosa TaxID=134698 RepID=A0ABN8BX88_9STRA|nr:unnamed protein product [Peronospora farinosa]
MSHWAIAALQTLTSLLAIIGKVVATTNHIASIDEDIQLSEVYGGSYGDAFSDMPFIKLGQTLNAITLRGGERLISITTQVATPAHATWNHGGSDGVEAVLLLDTNEYVDKMEIHWAKRKKHFRVFFVNISSSAGNHVWAGTKTSKSTTVTAPKGFQLSGFFGRSAGEVDQLGVIWTRRSAKTAHLTDRMGTEWYGKRIRNWVGPTLGSSTDSACYRQTKSFGSNRTCPAGYNGNDEACIAQCPLAYPVSCYLECIPQNDDCGLEIVQKVSALLSAVINVATAGIFGAVISIYKDVKREFLCAANIVGVIKSLLFFLRFQQTTAPQGNVEELLAVALQADVLVVDLPVAVSHCLGLPVSSDFIFSGIVMMVVEAIARVAITEGDQVLEYGSNIYRLIHNVTAVNTTHTSVDELQDFLDSGSTCGYQLKWLTDHIILSVNKVRDENPKATTSDVRVNISRSSLVLNDIPTATNNCMNEMLAYKTPVAAFKTRDLLRKTFGVIVDQLVQSATTDMGAFVAESEFGLETLNLALASLSGLDPTRFVWLASQFVQPVCGPTAFIGEIDDGLLHDALGLKTIDEAFVGSYGVWYKKGDGVVMLTFTSIDTKDVEVVIRSGGSPIANVLVAAGTTVIWNSTVTKLHEKPLYLDRWRPNFVGIPALGGGSLKLWVPSSSEGGRLMMHVRINVS